MWKSSELQLDSHIPTALTAASAAIPISNLPTIHRPFLAIIGTVQRSFCSRCTHQAVSRPAALPQLNLRGRCFSIVPANGCLTKLSLWSSEKIEGGSSSIQRFGTPQAPGDLRLPLTSTYHGCPRFFPDFSDFCRTTTSICPLHRAPLQVQTSGGKEERIDAGSPPPS
jgi:hypothetical protein